MFYRNSRMSALSGEITNANNSRSDGNRSKAAIFVFAGHWIRQLMSQTTFQ